MHLNPKVIGKKPQCNTASKQLVSKLSGERMSTPASNTERSPEYFSGRTRAIVIGIVLSIIGYLISCAYAKETITNYTGFIMLLLGIAICVIGAFATATTSLKIRFRQPPSSNLNVKLQKILFFTVWAIGIGVTLAVIGCIVGNAYAKETITNNIAYDLLLTGAGLFFVGAFGSAAIILRQHRKCPRNKQSKVKSVKRGLTFVDVLPIVIAAALVIAGSIIASLYSKQSIMNYAGFGTLLIGTAVLSIGIAKAVVTIIRNRMYKNLKEGINKPRLILGSIWTISIGLMLIIDGALIASSYAKNSIMNYTGFGMLLSGTGVFVYGLFETARIATLGYLSSKRANANADLEYGKPKEKLSVRFKGFWKNLVKTSAIINLIGVMVALGLLFFSLWQLDLIVSGPVWWESSPDGAGWGWPGPGAYANDYFQCFVWKTTIGQAYDTLFMLIFISFIVLFASAYFWPKGRIKSAA